MNTGGDNARFFKNKSPRSVQHSALHAPCPTCYTDVSPHSGRELSTNRLIFVCESHGRFFVVGMTARRHSTWLLTRNAPQVQNALRTGQQIGES